MKSLENKILKLYGKRHKVQHAICDVCQTWRLYDQLMCMLDWGGKDWDYYDEDIKIKKGKI